MKEQDAVKAFFEYYNELSYDTLEIKFTFTLGGSYEIEIYYFCEGGKKETSLDGCDSGNKKKERDNENGWIPKLLSSSKIREPFSMFGLALKP